MHLPRKLIFASAAVSVLMLAANGPASAQRRAPAAGYVDQDFGDSYEPGTPYSPGYAARPDDELSVGEVGAGLGPFTTEESLGPDF